MCHLLTALSHMPVVHEKLGGHLKTVYFEESPITSTCLLTVVIGLFEHIEDTTADGIKLCAYCLVGKSDKGRFALDVAVKALDVYTRYFSMPYTLPKLDMVAVPDFPYGAMENYGLITYHESELVYDNLHSSAVNKQRLAIVVTHEVAHQWFGNLVTMEWWTHLWLNEGFATWIVLSLSTPMLLLFRHFLGCAVISALSSSNFICSGGGTSNARSIDEVSDEIT